MHWIIKWEGLWVLRNEKGGKFVVPWDIRLPPLVGVFFANFLDARRRAS